jgi:tripartite-type tricarboxylate transporter receptor subunit TctC
MQLAHVFRLGLLLPMINVGASVPAVAQSYPSNTIRIVTSGPAGTPPDIVTRIVANELGQTEGWRIVGPEGRPYRRGGGFP